MSTTTNISTPLLGEEEQRLVVLAGDGKNDADDETCRTFIFKGETHTLGNALRSVILQNPEVLFCGYSMPHPAEDQMYLRIQTVEGITAQDALRKGLKDLREVCKVTKEKFEEAMCKFNNENKQN